MTRKVLIAVGVVLLIILAIYFLAPRETRTTDSITYEISDSPTERMRGLSGRTEIPGNYAMLFVFEEEDRHGFWMKEMHVPIDIVWVTKNGVIIGVEEAVSPDTYPDSYYPPEPVLYVLETRAGEARKLGWTKGTSVDLPL